MLKLLSTLISFDSDPRLLKEFLCLIRMTVKAFLGILLAFYFFGREYNITS